MHIYLYTAHISKYFFYRFCLYVCLSLERLDQFWRDFHCLIAADITSNLEYFYYTRALI